jgi:hypothetical protein
MIPDKPFKSVTSLPPAHSWPTSSRVPRVTCRAPPGQCDAQHVSCAMRHAACGTRHVTCDMFDCQSMTFPVMDSWPDQSESTCTSTCTFASQ